MIDMYTKTSVLGLSIGAGSLPFTGFAIGWYVVAATVLLVGGLLVMRVARRRGAHR